MRYYKNGYFVLIWNSWENMDGNICLFNYRFVDLFNNIFVIFWAFNQFRVPMVVHVLVKFSITQTLKLVVFRFDISLFLICIREGRALDNFFSKITQFFLCLYYLYNHQIWRELWWKNWYLLLLKCLEPKNWSQKVRLTAVIFALTPPVMKN